VEFFDVGTGCGQCECGCEQGNDQHFALHDALLDVSD
jgi:hypothetical protein